MVASGVGVVRSSFLWSQVERSPRRFDFDFYDRYIGQLARYGIRALPVLFGTPQRYSTMPAAQHPERARPRRTLAFARFVAAAAQRWGPRGSFWRRNPRIPRMPIRSWQVWNEPNTSIYWPPRPDARLYMGMLASASRAIKRVDPRAEVVLGGMPDSHLGTIEPYLRELYRLRAHRWFDSVALHPYARTAPASIAIVGRVRALMNRHGDRRARLWVTEFGWSSARPRLPLPCGGARPGRSSSQNARGPVAEP